LNPLTAAHCTVPAGNGREPRLLGCSFYRVYDGSKERVLHVMAVIRDDTRLAVLAKELRTLRAQAQTQAQGAVPAQGAAQPRS